MAKRVAELKSETLGDTLADVTAEALLFCVGHSVAEVEAATLYKTLSDIKA